MPMERRFEERVTPWWNIVIDEGTLWPSSITKSAELSVKAGFTQQYSIDARAKPNRQSIDLGHIMIKLFLTDFSDEIHRFA